MIYIYITFNNVSSTNLRKTADLHAIFRGFSSDPRKAKQREESSPT
jgi:hypothetical protein